MHNKIKWLTGRVYICTHNKTHYSWFQEPCGEAQWARLHFWLMQTSIQILWKVSCFVVSGPSCSGAVCTVLLETSLLRAAQSAFCLCLFPCLSWAEWGLNVSLCLLSESCANHITKETTEGEGRRRLATDRSAPRRCPGNELSVYLMSFTLIFPFSLKSNGDCTGRGIRFTASGEEGRGLIHPAVFVNLPKTCPETPLQCCKPHGTVFLFVFLKHLTPCKF